MATNNNAFHFASSFPNYISHKVEDSSFLLWRQLVKPIIKSNKLQWFIANPQIPLWFLFKEDHEVGRENPVYEAWE